MWTMLLGIAGGISILVFIVFAFRQGEKVHTEQEGAPPDRSGGYTP